MQTETSKYPEEEKNIDSVNSGERSGRAQTVMRASRGSDCIKGFSNDRRTALEEPARGVSPVSKVKSTPKHGK